ARGRRPPRTRRRARGPAMVRRPPSASGPCSSGSRKRDAGALSGSSARSARPFPPPSISAAFNSPRPDQGEPRMAGDLKSKYGATTQALTLTPPSLGASATVGREATAVDNSAALYLDVLLVLWFETGTVAGNKQLLGYFGASGAGGTTSRWGVSGAVTNALVHKTPARAIAQYLGGIIPDHWTVAVFNDTGAALTATAGNNKAYYQGVLAQYT